MTKASFPSDTITFKDVSTGGNSAGNGGDGNFSGKISNSPSISFNPSNKAEGADVHVNTGDHVYQKADWDAGGANPCRRFRARLIDASKGRDRQPGRPVLASPRSRRITGR